MPHEFVAADWNTYRIPAGAPGRPMEDSASEGNAVSQAISAMAKSMILPADQVDEHRYISFCRSIDTSLDVGPWQISPRAQRLLYFIAALTKPAVILAADCGNGHSLLMASGPAIGPNPVYRASDLIGCESQLAEAARGERNARHVDRMGLVRIASEDTLDFLKRMTGPIDMLLLGNGDGPAGSNLHRYLPILKAALPIMRPGGLVIAHGSMSESVQLRDYLAFVRNSNNLPLSMKVVIDPMGFEISAR